MHELIDRRLANAGIEQAPAGRNSALACDQSFPISDNRVFTGIFRAKSSERVRTAHPTAGFYEPACEPFGVLRDKTSAERNFTHHDCSLTPQPA